MVDELKLGPYAIALLPLYAGPLPAVKSGSESEALALLLNDAVQGEQGREIADAIEQRREGGDVIVYVTPAKDALDDRQLRADWAQKTGETVELGAVARVGMMGRSDTLAVSWDALRKALTELRAIRAAWRPEPGPWLFRCPGKSAFTTPEDHERIKTLENEATAIDELDLHSEVGAEPVDLIARRRRFLSKCEEAGVFAEDYAAEREKWLDYWFAERLLALRHAAQQLRSWGLLPTDLEVSQSRVCLDYVRLELWPRGENGERLARAALRLLQSPPEGEQGLIVERVGGNVSMRVWWRRDSHRPMLLAIART